MNTSSDKTIRNCFACTHPDFKLDFTLDGPHQVRTSIDFTEKMTSIDGRVHGGLIAFLIDEAMACAMMAEGVYGVTGDLHLRYLKPVRAGPTAHLFTSIEERFLRMYRITTELKQEGAVKVRAKARFMRQALAEGEPT